MSRHHVVGLLGMELSFLMQVAPLSDLVMIRDIESSVQSRLAQGSCDRFYSL